MKYNGNIVFNLKFIHNQRIPIYYLIRYNLYLTTDYELVGEEKYCLGAPVFTFNPSEKMMIKGFGNYYNDDDFKKTLEQCASSCYATKQYGMFVHGRCGQERCDCNCLVSTKESCSQVTNAHWNLYAFTFLRKYHHNFHLVEQILRCSSIYQQ